MIDLSELTFDEDLAVEVTVLRSHGFFGAGGWRETEPTTLGISGIVTPSSPMELQQVPEGDRVIGAITVTTATQLYQTHSAGVADPGQALSDRIVWHGDTHRIAGVWPWGDQGFWKAIAVRERGA